MGNLVASTNNSIVIRKCVLSMIVANCFMTSF